MRSAALAVAVTSLLLLGCSGGRQETRADDAPRYFVPGKTIGPYSPAVSAGGFVFISGQIALDSATGTLRNETIEIETAQVLENLRRVLSAAGCEPSDVVSATVYLKSMADYPAVNGVYAKFFPEGKYPARVAVEVAALPRRANVEISAVAFKR